MATNKKIPSGIKRRRVIPAPQREFEHVLPVAIASISNRLSDGVEVYEVYICLKQGQEMLSYDYKKE
ncbi:hypothetical protein [Lactococcus petauri]|jgi:hypothetical protein|uniref:hypothetical protein n=1 Tax=Lactococcus petauri TaxID=1940789 RepID=UPI002549ED23|nr:hypothetical protein [Lactococcus petauri]